MASAAYQRALKRRAIQDFVLENSRSPTQAELLELLRQYRERYPTIDLVGFSGTDTTKPQFKDESSAANETANRKAVLEDMFVLAERVEELTNQLEDSFRAFDASARRTGRLLSQIESRLDNLLLLNRDVDVFVYGVEEVFATQEAVDLSQTTAEVESGFVTLGRTGYSAIDLETVRVEASVTSDKGILSYQTSNKVDSIKKIDGSFWEAVVNTTYRTGRVTLILELTLSEPTYVGDIRLACKPVDAARRSTLSVLYSLDGQTWTAIKPAEVEVYSGENQVTLGKDQVRKIRILLSKDAADDQTTSANQYTYIFAIDSLQLYGDSYDSALESTLICGPYEVLDESGNPVYFTKAKVDCCGVLPEGTAVSFFLSQDGVTFQPASVTSDSLAMVSFGSSDVSGTYSTIDTTAQDAGLVAAAPSGLGLEFSGEAFLNKYVLADQADRVAQKSIEVWRNLPTGNKVYGVSSGWQFNKKTRHYSTVIYVEEEEGKSLQLGSTSANVNGQIQTGLVHLKQGYNTFETSDANWYEVDTDSVTTITELQQRDPAYPYNHKYIVEGFPYSADFQGEQVYHGVDVYFGALLRYVTPEAFSYYGVVDSEANPIDSIVDAEANPIDTFKADSSYGSYTIEDLDGNLYFKVKVDKQDASWALEEFEIKYLTQTAQSNQLYVKVLLQTPNESLTPKLDSFKVRVI